MLHGVCGSAGLRKGGTELPGSFVGHGASVFVSAVFFRNARTGVSAGHAVRTGYRAGSGQQCIGTGGRLFRRSEYPRKSCQRHRSGRCAGGCAHSGDLRHNPSVAAVSLCRDGAFFSAISFCGSRTTGAARRGCTVDRRHSAKKTKLMLIRPPIYLTISGKFPLEALPFTAISDVLQWFDRKM